MADKPLAATAASGANREAIRALRVAWHPTPNFISNAATLPVGGREAWTGGSICANDASTCLLLEECCIPQRAPVWKTCPTAAWRMLR